MLLAGALLLSNIAVLGLEGFKLRKLARLLVKRASAIKRMIERLEEVLHAYEAKTDHKPAPQARVLSEALRNFPPGREIMVL